MAVGDINGDGKIDITVASEGEAKLYLFRNQSVNNTISGTSFASRFDLTSAFQSNTQPHIVDMDGDGKPDLVVSNWGQYNIGVFRNLLSDPASITGFSPTSGLPLTRVTLTGSNFDNVTQVQMGTITGGAVLSFSPTSIVIRIPAGATTNQITLINNSGSAATSAGTFVVSGATPFAVITAVSPLVATLGSTVTVFGSGFDTNPSLNSLWFGATKMPVISATSNIMVVSVVGGASSSKITYQNSFGMNEQFKLPFTYSFSGGNITNGSFTNNASLSTGSQPYNVISYDLDGDGKPEIIATNYGASSNQLTISKNNATGNTITGTSFATPFNLSRSGISNPFQTSVGDLDGDGRPEIVVSYLNSYGLTIFKNNSLGNTLSGSSFSAPIDLNNLNFRGYGSAIADIDNDGWNDIISYAHYDNQMSIFRNLGNGNLNNSGFAANVNYSTGSNPSFIQVTDIDGDGKKDVILGYVSANLVSVFRNTSTVGGVNGSSFAARVDLTTPSTPYGVTFADVNGDGKPEIIASNYATSQVSIFQNNCTPGNITTGTFLRSDLNCIASSNPYNIHAGDVDGDGKPEIVVGGASTTFYSIFKNNYNAGNITSGNFNRIDVANTTQAFGIELADLDLDGKQEIITGNASSPIRIYKNQIGNGIVPTITGFSPTSGLPLATFITVSGFGFTSVSGVTLSNVSANSFTVVNANTIVFRVPNTTLTGVIGIANQFGTVGFSADSFTITGVAPIPIITLVSPINVANSDAITLSGNGFGTTLGQNVVYVGSEKVNVLSQNNNTLVVENQIGTNNSQITIINTLSGLQGVANQFVNNTFSGPNTIVAASFASFIATTTGASSYANEIADLDGDGRNDMISVGYGNNSISIFRNISTVGGFTFASRQDFTVGSNPFGLVVADFDNDGRKDIAVGNQSSNSISVFKNNSSVGNILLATRVDIFTSGLSPYGFISAGDIDGDGFLDLAIPCNTNGTLVLFKNQGIIGTITASSFGNRLDYTGLSGIFDAQILDIDGDNKNDLVYVLSGANQMVFRKNIGVQGTFDASVFGAAVIYVTSSSPTKMIIRDFDRDGKNDIAITNQSTSSLSIYKNNVVGNTITGTSFSSFTINSLSNPYGIVSADVDGDGRLDLVHSSYTSAFIGVNRNISTVGGLSAASFPPTISYPAQNGVYGLSEGDIDGDGKTDVVGSVYSSSTLNIWRNLSMGTPTITGFNPTSGQAGVTLVTLTGLSLDGVNRVSIGGGITQTIISATPSQLVFKVPASATNGPIIASNIFGLNATSTGTFTISAPYPYPSIAGITPLFNNFDNTISINGNNFSTILGNNVVYIGAARATITGASATNVTALVPSGSTYDAVTLLNRDNSISLTGSNYSFIPSLTFTGATTINGNTFGGNRIDIVSGNGGRTSVAADFDNDGKNDIAVGYSSTINVYKNNSSNGTLSGASFASSIFSIAGNPFEIAVADFDNDGRLDIVAGNQNSNNFSVLRNISSGVGNIAFASRVDFTATTSSTSNQALSVADIDLDGFMDIVLKETIGSNYQISIFRNSGTVGTITGQTFTEKIVLALGTSNPNDIEIADLNGDNYPEICAVISNLSANNIYVYRNRSQAGFVSMDAPTLISTNLSAPYVLRAADFDADGKRDLVIGHYNGSTQDIRYFRNTSTLTSISGTVFNYTNSPTVYTQGLDVGDIDGDGKIDVVFSDWANTAIRVYRNTSTSTGINQSSFAQSVSFSVLNVDGFPHLSDLDGDGRPEIFQFNNSSRLSIWKNQISSPATITGFAPSPAVAGVTIVTVTGIGLQNTSTIALANSQPLSITGANATSFIFKVPASGISSVLTVTNLTGAMAVSNQVLTITAFPYPTITSIVPLKAAQNQSIVINGNNFDSITGNNLVYFGNTPATPFAASATQLSVNVPFNATYQEPRVVNKTTQLMSDFGQFFTQTFSGLTTITSATFAAKSDFTALGSPYHVAVGDLDGDGKPEAISTSYFNGFISIYRNISSPGTWTGSSFATRVDINVGGYYLFEVKLADFDNDGKLDIALVNYNNSQLFILKNNCTVGNITASSFSQITYATGSNPYALAVADFDNDGKLDIITGNYSANTLSVFKNNGITGTITSASFTKLTDISSGGNVYQLEAADLNFDGKMDLVSANYNSNNFSILQNISTPENIQFRAGQIFSEATQPISVRVGDIDNDGKPDLAFTGYGSTSNVIYKNLIAVTGATINGSSFGNRTLLSTNATPYGLDLADLDGDGNVDIVSANHNSNNISVYRNNGLTNTISGASFSAKVDFTTSSNPSYPEVADMDLDGFPDIVVPTYGSNQVSVFRLNLSSTPTATGFNPTLASPFAIISISGNSLNSVNQVSFGGFSTNVITILGSTGMLVQVPFNAATGNIVVTNTQGATSTAPGVFTVIPIQYPSITGISPSSVSAGGSLIINGLNFNTIGGNNLIQLGAVFATVTGATSTQLTVNVPISASYDPIQVLDNQTKFRSNFSIPANLNFPNSGTILGSSFANAVNYSGLNQPYYAMHKDLNGDGKPEILVANYGSNYVTVFVNNSTGNTISGSSFNSFNIFPGFNNVLHITADDLDNDGQPDLAIVDYNGARVAVLKNNYTTGIFDATSFSTPVFYVTGTRPYTVAIGDIDFDGFNDVVVANSNSNSISVLKNNVTPGLINSTSFAARQDFIVGSSPVEIGIADLDNDGRLDVVTSNSSTQSVSILKNTAIRGIINTNSFSSVVNYSTPYNGYGLGLGDMNNDGKIDILASSYNSAIVMAFQNNSSANTITSTSFTRIDIAAPIYSYRNAKIADFDGDGKNDFAVPTSFTQVSVYRNVSTGVGLNTSSFASGVPLTTQSYPWGLSVGDLDGDFKPEIVAMNNSSNSLSILKNLQSGSNPTITALAPSSLIQGQSFTVNGTNFAGITSLRVNGQLTPFTISNASIIVSTLLGTATTGFVSISGFNGSAVSPGQLTVIPLLIPTITGFNPSSALPGSVISVLGNNFVSVTGISISGISVPFSIVNSQLSIITVPSAITGKATIVNYSGQTQSLANLQILTNAGSDFGRMAFFDGSNNFINIPASGNVFDNTNFTFEAMVKRARISAPNGQDRLFMSSNFGGIGVYFENNRLTFGKIGVGQVSTNNAISDTLWHHLAVSYNGSVAKFYYDGVFDSQQAYAQTFNSSNSTYNIGARGGSELFQGRIDEVRIWNTERTIGGINASRCGEILGNEPNLIGYYRLNENPNSTTVLDASPNGLHATIQNFTLPTERPVSTAKCYQAATILGFSPNPIVGGSATILSVSGLGFTDIVAVRLANFNLPNFTVSGNNIFLTMPTTVTNANLIVTNGTETTTSTGILTVTGLIPTFTSITPNAERRGRIITIVGSNFVNISGLTINGINSSYTLVNSQLLISTIAGNANVGAGNIAITNLAGIGTSSFTVTGTPAPTVTGVSPAFAINGNNITATVDEIEFMQSPITIGGTTLTNYTVSGNTITFVVPLTAITGHVRIRTLYGGISPTFTGSLLTILPPPTIADFGAVSTGLKVAASGCGGLGQLTTIVGNGFSVGNTDITLNNFNVLNPTVTSINMLVFRLPDLSGFPNQNLTGKLKITTPAGTVTSTQDLVALFCTITPTTTVGIKIGNSFEVTGNDLINVTAVSIAGFSATYNTNSNKLTVVVPNGVPSGNVTVILAQGSYSYTFPFNFYVFPLPTISGIIGSPALVGATISLTGFGLTSSLGVAFNGANQTIVSNINDNLITLQVPANAQNGFLNLSAFGGNASSPTQFVIAPSVSGILPIANGVGKPVTIFGSGLNGVTQVSFNGTNGSITSKTNSQIVLNVQNGATSGNVTVRITGYTSTGVFFTVVPPPTINNITPASATAGTVITISGSGYTLSGTNSVSFNGTGSANATVIDDNTLVVTVPSNASSGYITVANIGGSTTSSLQFLALPSLSGNFNPFGAGAGSTILVFGTNLFNPTLITFNNIIATSFSFVNSTTLSVVIPNVNTALPIPVKVTTDGGTSNTVIYTVAGVPSISSIAPGSGKAGDVVSIFGDNFNNLSNTVLINGASAATAFINKTLILATVPTNVSVSTGSIQVQNIGNVNMPSPNNYATSPSNFITNPTLTAILDNCNLTSVTSSVQGRLLKLEGSNFISGNTQVFFNGVIGNISSGFAHCFSQFTSFGSTGLYVFVPAGATSGNVIVRTNSNPSNPIFLTIIPPPTVTTFSPLSAVAGSVITISGTGFDTVSGVSFAGNTASFSIINSQLLVATVSGTMGQGKISVSAFGGTGTSVLNFTPIPVVTGFNYSEAPINSFINILGTNLTGATQVDFNGGVNSIWSNANTSVTVIVPSNANTGTVSLSAPGGTAVSPTSFTVSTILGISTTSGPAGTIITLTGNGLTSANAYSFAPSISFTNIVSITGGVVVTVPNQASTGMITLIFPNNGTTSIAPFNPTPIITSVSPNTHGTDQLVNIIGTNLGGLTAASFGGVLSNSLGSAAGSNRNNVRVPSQGLSGTISVTVAGGGVATSPTSFTVISISGVLPGTALAGTEITISGANLDNLSGITIGGTSVVGFTSTFSQIITTVPSSISSGQIIVSKDGGFNDSFAINLPNASITGITPSNGPIGTVITINGNNFTDARGVQLYNASYNPFVFDINYRVISATRIVATVTGNGISGNIRVVGQNNNIATGGLFIMPPVLNTLPNPGVLPAGQTVVLNGGNLTAPTTINIGGINVSVINYNANSLTFLMPTVVGNNIITAGNSAGTSTVNFNFFSIASLHTNTGFAGQIISISGTSFGNVSNVRFNNTNSTFSIINSQLILATVPGNAGNGLVSVQAGTYIINSTATFQPRPVITGFVVTNGINSNTAASGNTVSLTGTNLNNVNSVIFNTGSNAYISFSASCQTGNSATSLFPLCVPSNASSGTIVASNGTFTASFAGFNFVGMPGTISGIATAPGTQVTISGMALNTVTGVSFGGLDATSFTQTSATQIIAVISANSTISGSVVVRTLGGNTSNTFTAPPIITSFSQNQGAVGLPISVNALNIGGINQVIFATNVSTTGSNNGSSITVNIPAGAVNGFVNIANAAGIGTSPIAFNVLPMPTISGFSPSNGEAGTTVLINGTNLDLITGVSFGNGTQSASFTIISPTQISVTAPANVLTGKIHITNSTIYPTSIISPTDFIGSPLFTSVVNISNNSASYIGKVGENIRINGSNFTNPAQVYFNGTQASTVNYISSSQIEAIVPSGATTGLINVSGTGGNFFTNSSFEVVNVTNLFAIVTNSCAGSTFSVNYTVTGFFPIDNIFTVDVMNGSAVVASAVGTRAANNSGFVSAIIPANVVGIFTMRLRASSGSVGYQFTSIGSNTVGFTNINDWLGYTNNWSTPTNWGCSVLPTAQSYVTIPSSPIGGNQPTIFGSATAGTVDVQNGQLTLTSAGILTLFGDLKLTSTAAFIANPTSYVLVNNVATITSQVGHAEVGNITIATAAKLTLGSALKVKGSFVNNVNTFYYASYFYGWYNIYGFNSNGYAVTVEGTDFQTVGNPGYYATLFDELILNNNTSGAGVSLAGPVQVKCKLINYGIFNANGFLTEFVNGPCSPTLQAENPMTVFDNIIINNTLTSLTITKPIRVRGNFTRSVGAAGVAMPVGSGIEFVGTTAPQLLESNGQPMVINDLKIENPFGLVLGTTPGNDLEIKGNFINNGKFTDSTNTVSLSGANITVGGTGTFNLNTVEITPTATVILKKAIRVRGNFKSNGVFNAGSAKVTFANTGVQSIQSTGTVSFAAVDISPNAVVTTTAPIVMRGDFTNDGVYNTTSPTTFGGDTVQIVAGAGSYLLQNISNVNTVGTNVNVGVQFSGDLVNNGPLTVSTGSELTFTGVNQVISGTAQPDFADIKITSTAGITLNRSVRVRGNFKAAGTLTPNGQTVNFGGTAQTIESQNVVRFSTVNIENQSQVISSAPLALDGNMSNGGSITVTQPTSLTGSMAQTISGAGNYVFNSITNNNSSTVDSVQVLAPIKITGNFENNSKLFSASDLNFTGSNQTISGTVEPVLTNMALAPSASVALTRGVRVRGNFTNNSATNGLRATAPVTLEGNSVQTISGTAPTAFAELNLQNNAGVDAQMPISVSGLNIRSRGKLKVPQNVPLVVSSSANNAITRSDTGYLVGGIQRAVANALGEYIFPVGNETQYRGAVVTFTGAASGTGTLAVNNQDALPQLPTGQLSPLNSALQAAALETILPLYWNVNATNITGGQYDINFDAKLAGTSLQSAAGLQIVKRTLPTDLWALVGNAAPASFADSKLNISRTNLSGFSQFAIAGACSNVASVTGKAVIKTIAGIGINNDTLLSNTTGTSYQWSRNGVIVTVSGALRKFKPVRSGEYRLTVFQNGCRTPISDKALVTFVITFTGLEDNENDAKPSTFRLYPNPAKTIVNLEIENAKLGNYTITVFDMIGKAHLMQTIAPHTNENLKATVDISTLAQGIYFVKITQNGETKVLKLVVE